MTTATRPIAWLCPDWRSRLGGTVVFGIAIAILFRDLLLGCVNRWATEPQYSHGFAIPIMALGLGWFSRHKFQPGTARSNALGLAMILGGIVGTLLPFTFMSKPSTQCLFCSSSPVQRC